MVGRAIYPEGERLLERPCHNFLRKQLVPRSFTVRQQLVRILVAEQVDASREHDARVFKGLESRNEAKLAACPEPLAGLLGRVKNGVCASVVYGVSCEAFRGCSENGYQVGAVPEGVRNTGEPHRWDIGGEKWRFGYVHGDEGCWFRAGGVMRYEGCARWWGDE